MGMAPLNVYSPGGIISNQRVRQITLDHFYHTNIMGHLPFTTLDSISLVLLTASWSQTTIELGKLSKQLSPT